MSNADTSDLLQTLYSNLAQTIVQQCLGEIQQPDFLSKLDLSAQINPVIQQALEQSSNSTETAELSQQVAFFSQQISFMEQMIALLQTALEDQGTEIDSLKEHNERLQESQTSMQTNIDRLQNKVKQLEKENAAFRVEISNNRTFVLDRLNSLQEEIDRLQE